MSNRGRFNYVWSVNNIGTYAISMLLNIGDSHCKVPTYLFVHPLIASLIPNDHCYF